MPASPPKTLPIITGVGAVFSNPLPLVAAAVELEAPVPDVTPVAPLPPPITAVPPPDEL